jgi:hypothetical protein
VDAVASAALVLGLRVVLRFDPVHLRLLTPTLYAAGLAVLVGLSYVPWREVRGGLLLPVGLLALWHGGAWTAAAIRAPAVPSTLRGPWCRPGPQGDCAMLAWLRGHTTRADLIAGNAAFTVNFALHRTTEEIEAPPVDPVLTAPVLRTWAANWDAAHPGGVVFLALDTAAASMGGTGPLLGALWANPNTALPGLALTEVASGPSYRVWLVLPNDAVPVLGPG